MSDSFKIPELSECSLKELERFFAGVKERGELDLPGTDEKVDIFLELRLRKTFSDQNDIELSLSPSDDSNSGFSIRTGANAARLSQRICVDENGAVVYCPPSDAC